MYAADIFPVPELTEGDRADPRGAPGPAGSGTPYAKALGRIQLYEALATTRLGGAPFVKLADIAQDDTLIGGLRRSVVQITQALTALAPLTDDHDLTQERIARPLSPDLGLIISVTELRGQRRSYVACER